ncbi:MAG: hypothetical protein RLZZ590_662 [Actinomycetota bacterium]
MKIRSKAAASAAAVALLATTAMPANAAEIPTYVEAVAAGVTLDVLATSGDFYGSYQLAGVPDGMGAYKSGNAIKLLMNHELSYGPVSSALSRAGGAAFGSTVTEFTLDAATRKVTEAKEFLTSAVFYDYATGTFGVKPGAPVGAAEKDSYGTPQHTNFLNRFCSASLAPAGRLSWTDTKTKKVYGVKDSVFFTAEESGDESRAFAVNASGQIAQMPKFGLGAFETFVTVPTGTKTTALFGNEDGSATDSQLRLYQGTKTTSGAWYDKAGLTNGKSYVMSINGLATEAEFRALVGKGKVTDVQFKQIDNTKNGVEQNKQAALLGTSLARVEDGAFDPSNPRDYYFVTTESNKDKGATALDPGNPLVTKRDGGALWRLRLADVKNPAKGGELTMLLNGTEAPFMNKPDNIEVDGFGNILIQEDPGNNAQLERMFAYRIKDGKIAVLTQFKASMFSKASASPEFITEDEEQSGVLNVTNFFRKSKTDTNSYYVLNAQVHATGADLLKARPDITTEAGKSALLNAVEGGQVYLLTIPNWTAVYGG